MGDDETPSAGSERPADRFPCSSRVLGMVTLAGLVIVFVLVFLDGRSLGHWTVLAAIALLGLSTWLTMVRPAVQTHDDHVLVRNALTDTKVPWHLVESVELRQVLVIRTDDRVVHSIAVGRSVRQQFRDGRRGTRSGQGIKAAATFGGDSVARIDYADFVVRRLDELATENRRRSLELDRPRKLWRTGETTAVAVVALAFVVLLGIVVAR